MDKFFDFLADNSHLTDAEVREELDAAGIDMEPAYRKLREAIERRKRDDLQRQQAENRGDTQADR